MKRRDLLKLATSVAAAPAILSPAPAGKLRIAVSTLGCPKWDWNTIIKNTSQWGFAALELRGIQDQMDLPKCPEFSGTRLPGALRDLSAAGLAISDLGASRADALPIQMPRTADELGRGSPRLSELGGAMATSHS